MNQELIDAIEKAAEADKRFSKSFAEGFHMALESVKERQRTFEDKKKAVQQEIDRGSRLTKHRISL